METKEVKTKQRAEGTVAEKIKGMNLVAKILLMAIIIQSLKCHDEVKLCIL